MATQLTMHTAVAACSDYTVSVFSFGTLLFLILFIILACIFLHDLRVRLAMHREATRVDSMSQ